jgi:MSHA biogenesis protein MshJ
MSTAAIGLSVRYAGISRRERAVLLTGALLLVVGLGYLLMIEPTLTKRALLLKQMEGELAQQQSLRQSLSAPPADGSEALRLQLAETKSQLRAADQQFSEVRKGLVQPQQMGALLQSLLARHRGLQLLSLRSLPVAALSESGLANKARAAAPSGPAATASAAGASAEQAADGAWLYRHGVEIRIEGSYADLLAYVQALEQLPRRVYWGDLEIDARRSPVIVMTLTISTVSLEKTWWIL